MPHELREKNRERHIRQQEKLLKAKKSIMDNVTAGESQLAPTMSEGDVEFLVTTQATHLRQRDIIKMYVGNWAKLDLK